MLNEERGMVRHFLARQVGGDRQLVWLHVREGARLDAGVFAAEIARLQRLAGEVPEVVPVLYGGVSGSVAWAASPVLGGAIPLVDAARGSGLVPADLEVLIGIGRCLVRAHVQAEISAEACGSRRTPDEGAPSPVEDEARPSASGQEGGRAGELPTPRPSETSDTVKSAPSRDARDNVTHAPAVAASRPSEAPGTLRSAVPPRDARDDASDAPPVALRWPPVPDLPDLDPMPLGPRLPTPSAPSTPPRSPRLPVTPAPSAHPRSRGTPGRCVPARWFGAVLALAFVLGGAAAVLWWEPPRRVVPRAWGQWSRSQRFEPPYRAWLDRSSDALSRCRKRPRRRSRPGPPRTAPPLPHGRPGRRRRRSPIPVTVSSLVSIRRAFTEQRRECRCDRCLVLPSAWLRCSLVETASRSPGHGPMTTRCCCGWATRRISPYVREVGSITGMAGPMCARILSTRTNAGRARAALPRAGCRTG
ncbi:uncharacterized protein SOCE26_007720 [Sorangium cellulosum]|uniref:Uncharacterized protein n=1 Tax=Sorangium cellulosum TaxID=56 RepID=A0A2L0EJA8_SORCE|nr:uncharacterized protein SOCE26_007720 [Sorangium cellulosum]